MRPELRRRLERLEAVDSTEAATVFIVSSVPEDEMPSDSNYRRWIDRGHADMTGRVVHFHGGQPEPMTLAEWATEFVTQD
jgi:hypothetical protein